MVSVIGKLECDDTYEVRSPEVRLRYQGSLWCLRRTDMQAVYRSGIHGEGCDRWFSTAYLSETLPCVVFILMKHGHNLEESDSSERDAGNNSTSAVVGAACGARW